MDIRRVPTIRKADTRLCDACYIDDAFVDACEVLPSHELLLYGADVYVRGTVKSMAAAVYFYEGWSQREEAGLTA